MLDSIRRTVIMLGECVRMSFSNILGNRARSFLTVLGILIGVAAVIALITTVNGFSGSLSNSFSSMGAGTLTVTVSGSDLKSGMTTEDLTELTKLDAVEGVTPNVTLSARVSRGGSYETRISVSGKNSYYFRQNADILKRGRTINITDEEYMTFVCIVSPDMVEWTLQKTYEFARLMSYYKCAMMEIETKLNVLNEEFSLRFDRQPISSIHTRLKQPISIHGKLVAKGLPLTVESIENYLNDIAGIRVICSFEDDVYKMAEALLKQDDITLIQKKDYIQNPKPNGYRSLHLIVAVPIFLEHEKRIMRAEVQLRTIAMDSWASLEHQLRYKKSNDFDQSMTSELQRCAELSTELDARMDHLRSLIYTDESD